MNGIKEMKFVPIDSVKPYKLNPRKVLWGGVDALSESIKKFGWQKPILIDKNNVIIAGHTRLMAAQRLGLTEIPVAVADWLTDEQVKAYRLADNKIAELSEWDFEKLAEEIKTTSGIDFSELGFSEIELFGLLGEFEPEAFGDEEGYEDIGTAQLKAKSVTITFEDNEEEALRTLLKTDEALRVVYSAEEMMARAAVETDNYSD